MTKNSGQDGEVYNGSDATKRNIVMVLEISRGDFLRRAISSIAFSRRTLLVLYTITTME